MNIAQTPKREHFSLSTTPKSVSKSLHECRSPSENKSQSPHLSTASHRENASEASVHTIKSLTVSEICNQYNRKVYHSDAEHVNFPVLTFTASGY